MVEPMYLRDVENKPPEGTWGEHIERLRQAGPVSQLYYLFAFKPDRTMHLMAFVEAVMRGPSPLSPGLRELVAAFTSRRNECFF
jgi:alkylhydroperoxidase family enzyme